jgi:hypothetical protein
MSDVLKNISKGVKKKDMDGNNKPQADKPAEKQDGSSFFERLRKGLQNPNRKKLDDLGYDGFVKKNK